MPQEQWTNSHRALSNWEYPDVSKALDDEDDLPELTVSERILRGDFDA